MPIEALPADKASPSLEEGTMRISLGIRVVSGGTMDFAMTGPARAWVAARGPGVVGREHSPWAKAHVKGGDIRLNHEEGVTQSPVERRRHAASRITPEE
jgi:hypothetical protein